MDVENLISSGLPSWALVIGLVVLSTIIMVLVKRFILSRVNKLTEKSAFFLDSLLLTAVSFPLTICIIALNLWFLDRGLLYFGVEVDRSITGIATQVLLVAALILFIDSAAHGALARYSKNSEVLQSSQSLIKGISRAIIFGIGILVLLGTLGISITPLVASLGISSLAVALALQPTLESFFSGVQLVVDKSIRVGDYIELDSGEQGFVEKIGWRTTWIKMLPNNTIIIPNSILSQSKLINYYYPEKQLSVPVDVGVHYDSDLEHVERVTLEVAREILVSHKWGIDDYDTFVVFHTFADSSINFTVMLRAEEYFNRFFIKSEFIKALHKRYKEEGINIPYPIRAINYEQEKAKP